MKSGSTDAPGWLQWGETRTAADGLVERDFVLEVALASPEGEPETERVPGVLWSAAGASRPGTLVLGGHGFCVHKRVPFPLPVVRSLASEHGCAVAILDAPEHGDRRKDPAQDAQATADAWTAYWARYVGSRVAREYEAAAAALQALPEIADGPVGYWGLSLATQYGLGWLAETERCGAAVLGLFRRGPVVAYYAQRVRAPVFFVQQLADEIHPADAVTALYDEIASDDKQLAASPGAHVEVPDEVCERAVAFLLERCKGSVS